MPPSPAVKETRPVLTLVLGGTRSGKSEVAESLLRTAGAPVTYVATSAADDASMAERVAAHRARRPATWRTVEAGVDLPAIVRTLGGPLLIDSLGTWVARCADLDPDVDALCEVLRGRAGPDGPRTVVVSEEVGLGVHPPTALGVRFADALGTVNRAVADVADEVLLVVAGRVLPLDRPNVGA